MSKPENPSAFPNTGNSVWNLTPEAGMTLRDWFAGQALIALADRRHDAPRLLSVAEKAYVYADAMLAERARAQGGAA